MKFNYELTDNIVEFIENCDLEEIGIGCSNSQVIKITKEENNYYLKIANKGLLTLEYEKLKWLDGKLPVPKISLYEVNDKTEYLITEEVKGNMLCSKYYEDNPSIGIKLVVEALKKVWSLNIKDCPFDVSIDKILEIAENNIKNKIVTEENVNNRVLEKYGNLENALKYLKDNKFYEPLCFTFGDPSLPNFIGIEDKLIGFIDIGDCGIGDKWFDIAICEKSIIRNYGKEYIDSFYKELNIIPDREKIEYYLLILDLYA